MKTLVIIPAYNEEECIAQTVGELTAERPDIDYLIVNDGSTDATHQICVDNGFGHLDMPVNSGLTCGFQAGMKYAMRHGYDAAIQFDADGQHLPCYIKLMEDKIQEGFDIVIASRFLEGKKGHSPREIGNSLIGGLIRLTSGVKITDPTSGMRMYSRNCIKEYANSFDLAPEPDAIVLLSRRGYKVTEIPATIRERQGGESYLNLPSIVSYMSRTCLSILMFRFLR